MLCAWHTRFALIHFSQMWPSSHRKLSLRVIHFYCMYSFKLWSYPDWAVSILCHVTYQRHNEIRRPLGTAYLLLHFNLEVLHNMDSFHSHRKVPMGLNYNSQLPALILCGWLCHQTSNLSTGILLPLTHINLLSEHARNNQQVSEVRGDKLSLGDT